MTIQIEELKFKQAENLAKLGNQMNYEDQRQKGSDQIPPFHWVLFHRCVRGLFPMADIPEELMAFLSNSFGKRWGRAVEALQTIETLQIREMVPFLEGYIDSPHGKAANRIQRENIERVIKELKETK